jgi:spore germination protein YaaH
MDRPSEMAVEWLAHAADHIAFTPGAKPLASTAASQPIVESIATASTSTADLHPLAPTDGSGAQAALASLPNGLKKQVFGFLPYWMLGASDLQWMRYDLVSTMAYFGVAARSDGSLATTSTGWSGWNSASMTGVINAAHRKGDKVVLTVTMMAWDSASANAQAALLGSATYRTRLVNNIVAAVRNRSADGVNLDFEPLATSLRGQYTAFVRQLKAALLAAHVGSYLTVCTTAGAATWATGYDLSGLTAAGASDGIFAMGYDYSWSGSSRAGGVAPMESSYMLDVNQSVTDFLSMMPASKLIWGVPYYGRTWHTTSSALNTTTVAGASGSSKAYYYTGAKSLATAHGRKWDSLGRVPWFVYYDNTLHSWIEGYYDDPTSLGVKYDMINSRGLAGVGMWHLLMDGGVSDLWNLIANKFQRDTVPPTGGITSMPAITDAYAMTVRWRAVDVGSGIASYSVQLRDRTSATWSTWLAATTTTSATYIGTRGHAYEFRVAAKDRLGNTQPWQLAMAAPGAALAVGGFASVTADVLNVRSAAGTAFETLTQLAKGARVAVLAGPVSSSGYQWYQVQFGFSEWPSADYPRAGWVAAGDASGPFLAPTVAPTVTTISPWITGYAPAVRSFSPNGDGRSDGASVAYTIPAAADSVRLDVLEASGTVVDSISLGAQAAGGHVATWNGHLTAGSWAPAGSYVLRLTVTAGGTSHVAPASGVSAPVLARWGVVADLTPPAMVVRAPTGTTVSSASIMTVTFSEAVSGVSGSSLTLVDLTSSTPVSGNVSYDPATRVATIKPTAALTRGHSFRVSLGSAIQDAAGNPLAPTSWTFTTLSPYITLYSPPRTLVFLAGTTVGYRFNGSGAVVASRAFTLTSPSSATTSQRSTAIAGHAGAWFYVTNGVWAGYFVQESPRVYLPGVSEQVVYSPVHTVSFLAGTHVGYRFSSSWQISGTRSYALARSSSASANRWAVINGRAHVAIVNGVWAGYWIPVGSGVTVH